MTIFKYIVLSILIIVMPGLVFPKYHPEINWKEISNKRFIVVFPAGYEEEAVYTLKSAGDIQEKLFKLWGDWIHIRGRIRILLSDAYDDSNGKATFFPFNQIEIYLLTPPPDSSIGNAKEWIRTALSHEMTHIFNFNAGSGFTYFMRKILGSNPLLYPTLVMPVWMEEGLAVYAESKIDEGGRLNTPDFKLMLNSIAQKGKMPGWGDIWGDPTQWPGSTAKYLYGAEFVQFLAKTYGTNLLPEFIKSFAFHPLSITLDKDLTPVKLNIRHRFKRTYGISLSKLWNQFLKYTKNNISKHSNLPKQKSNPVKLLTKNGKYKQYPLLTKDNKIIYVSRNYKENPGIYSLDTTTGKSHRLIEQEGINGMFYWEKENKIYFSATEYYKSFYLYSDIYSLDIYTKEVNRLSSGKRLFYPTKANTDDTKIYCVKRQKNHSHLAVFDLNTKRDTIISKEYNALAYPAISPDNKYIAVSLKHRGEQWKIALFDLKGQFIKYLSDGLDKSYYPYWKNQEELFFISTYNDSYKLAICNIKTNSIQLIDDPQLPALRYYSLHQGENQEKIAVSLFDANGFNLAMVDLSQLNTIPLPHKPPTLPQTEKNPLNREEELTVKTKDQPNFKKYNYLREMFPKYLDGIYRSGGNEMQPGILIGSRDLLMKHSFTTEFFYGLTSKTANFILNYTYDGFYPSISIRYSDLSEFNHSPGMGDFIHKERKFELISLTPLHYKENSQSYFYSNIHFETAGDDLPDLPPGARVTLNGMKLGFFFNSAKRFYDSISLSDGIGLSLSYSREFKWLGSDYRINSAALQLKYYLPLFRPNVLAFRFGIMDSWGEARRLFYMGGAKPQETFHTAGSNMFDLMRGYPSGYFKGTGGYLFNIEYRMSLFKIENVFLSISSIERLYLSIFADIGNVWMKKWSISPSYSLGMEFNLILVMSDIRINAATGIAVAQSPYHSPVIYFRVGNSF